MNFKTTSILLSLNVLLFCNFQCNDCENELDDRSSYTCNINPLSIEYFIGDTITISSNFSSNINLDLGGTSHDNSNQTMSFALQFFEVKSNNQLIVDGIEDFEIISNNNEIVESPYYDDRLAKNIVNMCNNTSCGFSITVIPKSKGIFCFSLLNSNFGDDECQHLSLIDNNFGLTDNNFSIAAEINTTNFRLKEGTFYKNPEENKRFYFFKIKE